LTVAVAEGGGGREARSRREVRGSRSYRAHVRCHLPALQLGAAQEVAARDFAELDRELVFREPRERLGQFVDRVVRARDRAVAAGVLRLHPENDSDFLGGLQAVQKGLAVLQLAAAALVEGEIGVDEFAVVHGQPIRAVPLGGRAELLVGGQRDDDVAVIRAWNIESTPLVSSVLPG